MKIENFDELRLLLELEIFLLKFCTCFILTHDCKSVWDFLFCLDLQLFVEIKKDMVLYIHRIQVFYSIINNSRSKQNTSQTRFLQTLLSRKHEKFKQKYKTPRFAKVLNFSVINRFTQKYQSLVLIQVLYFALLNQQHQIIIKSVCKKATSHLKYAVVDCS